MTLCYKVFPAHTYIACCVMWYGFMSNIHKYSVPVADCVPDIGGGLLHQCVRPSDLLLAAVTGVLKELIPVDGSIEGLTTNWWHMLVLRALLGISEAAFGPGMCPP